MSAAVDFTTALISAVQTQASATAYFGQVLGHEPLSPPVGEATAAFWWLSTVPARSSGLASTSVVVTLLGRIYIPATTDSPDQIDIDLNRAVTSLFLRLSNNFTLAGLVRAVDLLGMEGGTGLTARGGWLPIDGAMFRIADLTIPLITNDVYDQNA